MRGPAWILALGGALILAGAGFDSPSLLVAGVGLALLVVVMSLWVEAAARLVGVERAPGPPRVVEGELYPLRIQVRAPLPLPGGDLDDPLLAEPLPVGPSRRSYSAAVEVWGRGRRRLEPPALTVRDPLGLRERRAQGGTSQELLVLPAICPVEAAGPGGEPGGRASRAGAAGAGSWLDAAAIDFEIDGLRPYRPGTPATRIHWPSVARSGEMVERRLVAGSSSVPLVALDAARPLSAEALDQAVRAAASLCLHLGRRGGCSLLLPGAARPIEVDPALSRWDHAHARLALVEAGEKTVSAARSRAALFWVTAGDPDRALRAARAAGPGGAVLVSPAPAPGLSTVFTVAGCSGQPLRSRLGAPSAPMPEVHR
jgi:uncharacterized protein (DUF58 family)